MIDVCAVCGHEVDEAGIGIGSMLFHRRCLPACKFCERPYLVQEAGWDFRGGVVWSHGWGYVPRLESAACPTCTDDAERRDYGAGWQPEPDLPMRVVMISKALVVAAYQRKLEEIAAHPDVELTLVVPTVWDGQRYEPGFVRGYRTIVQPIRFDSHFHFFYFPTLGRILRQIRPDVVHVDEEPYNLATALATRQALAVGARPLFFTWQNLLRRYPPPYRWFERYVYSRSRYAIAGNAEAVDVLRQKGYGGPCAVIPQFGVDPDLFSPETQPEQAGARPFTIGHVGRLTPVKGIPVLLDAVASLNGDWRLRLIGAGPLRATIPGRARELGIEDRVTVEPYVPSTEVPARLRELDVLALPSLTTPSWKEQFGRVLQEAMACAVPVVGSDSGEIPHVIGDAGLIVREGDPEALRDALDRLRIDPGLRRQLGRRGRARVLERFTQASVAARTVEVYRQVAES